MASPKIKFSPWLLIFNSNGVDVKSAATSLGVLTVPVLSDGLLQLIKLPLAVVIKPKLPNIASNFFRQTGLVRRPTLESAA
jgi:hypothetical protein